MLALASQPDGTGVPEALAAFMTNPAGAAIVNAIGPIRSICTDWDQCATALIFVFAEGTPAEPGAVVQRQTPD